jgi:hypothetical protein
MADIITSLEPGWYQGARTVTVTFPVGVRKAIVTRDDRAPILSEILAYDVGSTKITNGAADPSGPQVQRPFMAVTQDGKGNVVYDGGFPKFYNIQLQSTPGVWPTTPPATFAALTAASKYLANAFNFCSNPRKVAAGNKKVLIVNNCLRDANYNVVASHYNPAAGQHVDGDKYGFRDSFDAVCRVTGHIPTYYDMTTNGGGTLDLAYSYFDQFALVLFMSSAGLLVGGSNITERMASDLSAYRIAGNGVIIITDHSTDNYTSIADAVARDGIFTHDATKVAKYFGAYFSGNVDRSPVQVGEIRRQIGLPGPPEDHPLLANLADSDFIYAGGSESLIIPDLYPNDQVDPTQPYVATMNTAGTYRVNVLVQMETGEIITKPMKFIIIDPSDIKMYDGMSHLLTPATNTIRRAFDYTIKNSSNSSLTMTGDIIRNDVLQGHFAYTNDNTVYQLFSGGNIQSMPIANNDTVGFFVREPFEFKVTTTITATDLTAITAASGSIPQFIKALRSAPDYTGFTDVLILADLLRYANSMFANAPERNVSSPNHWWRNMGKMRLPFTKTVLADCSLWVATTPADWTAAKPANPTKGIAAIVASTNDVYWWDDLKMVWTLHSQKANQLFGLGRGINNTRPAANHWIIGAASTALG